MHDHHRNTSHFCWTELGSWQVAIVHSPIPHFRSRQIDVHSYLGEVLQRLGQHPASRVAEPTPRL
jgi:hypothetical protein